MLFSVIASKDGKVCVERKTESPKIATSDKGIPRYVFDVKYSFELLMRRKKKYGANITFTKSVKSAVISGKGSCSIEAMMPMKTTSARDWSKYKPTKAVFLRVKCISSVKRNASIPNNTRNSGNTFICLENSDDKERNNPKDKTCQEEIRYTENSEFCHY